jgi:hypothetical protein
VTHYQSSITTVNFFKRSTPNPLPTPVSPQAPASPAAQPTPFPSNAVVAQLQTILRMQEQGFARIEKRIGRIERDLIDLKSHHRIQRRPPNSSVGRHNENDEPTAIVHVDQ